MHAVFEQAEGKVTAGDPVPSMKSDVAGAAVSFKVWNKDIRPVWSMRWAPGGLMPVRPEVVSLIDIEIPAKMFLKLWGPA